MAQRPRSRASLVASYPSVFAPGPPSNLTVPSIAGVAQVGSVLTRINGAWSGGGLTYAHQWLANGVAISGATGATYTPVAGDVGKTISVRTTATNGLGSASATSSATAAVIAASGSSGAPSGFTYFADPDGSRLTDPDGAYLMEAA